MPVFSKYGPASQLLSDVQADVVVLSGAPHATEQTGDLYHASAALRCNEDLKGSGLSLHVYPDGMVRPSKSNFPTLQVTPATKEQLGHDSHWLDIEFLERGRNHSAVVVVAAARARAKRKRNLPRALPQSSTTSLAVAVVTATIPRTQRLGSCTA